MKSVIKPWVSELTFKQQTVLLTAIRGCDGVEKEDISKKFIRKYREALLHNAVPDDPASKFMVTEITEDDLYYFCKSMDHYPMHWLFHFLHAVEILGYKAPDEYLGWWYRLYLKMVCALHLNTESESEMDCRLRDGIPSDCWKT
jgi:hypothetical protein